MAKRIEEATIYLDIDELMRLIDKALLMMTAANRRGIGARAYEAACEVLKEFVLTYEFPEERYYHFKALVAEFALLVVILRRIANGGALQSPNPNTHERPETIRLLIFERIAKIDDAIGKWKTTIVKSRHDHGRQTVAVPDD